MPPVDLDGPSRPDETVPETTRPPETPSSAPRPLRVLLESLPLALVAIGLAGWIYRVWDQKWSQPFRSFGPDVYFIESTVKAMQTHTWYLHNPSLNAPFGQQTYDYPNAGENLQLGLIKVFAAITHTPGEAVNLYYLVGFGLLAMVTYAVFRHLRFGAVPAASAALLYTFLPYHFWHMEDHLFRSTYLSAPIAALLLLWALAWRTTFLADADGPLWGVRRLVGNLEVKRVIAALVLCGVVATFETMTIAFFLTTLALTSIVVAIRRRDPAQLAVMGVGILACGLAFGISISPNLRYWAANGTNSSTGARVPTEQESFGLQVSQMFLPVPNHRIKAVRGLQKNARKKSPIAGEGGQELGVVGAAGLLVLLFGSLTRGVRKRVREPFHDRGVLWEHAGLCTMVLIPVACASGLALLLSINGFAQVRVWNRVVVLIGFFAFLMLAIGVERLLDRTRPGGSFWRSRPVAVGLVVLLTVFGLYDTAVPRKANYGNAADISDLMPFVAGAEHLLPKHAEVFQLPITPFPETPAKGTTQEYDQLLPYLWSNGLRWSAGGMRGRPDADWQVKVFHHGTVASLPALSGLGFEAIEVDTNGYDDGGTSAVSELTAALGKPAVVSPSGRWMLWDLRPWAAKEGLTPAQTREAASDLVGTLIYRIEPAS